MGDFKYEIIERIAILSESSKGWTKEKRKIIFRKMLTSRTGHGILSIESK